MYQMKIDNITECI